MYLLFFLLLGLVFVCSLIGTHFVRRWLLRQQILDCPNARSNHTLPTPRGGGIAVCAAILFGTALLYTVTDIPITLIALLSCGILLAIVSFIDDIWNLAIHWRLLAQCIAVATGLTLMGNGTLIFQGWFPPLIDHILAGLLWLWFINLYNFMDGIDGITGIETLSITTGIAILFYFSSGELTTDGQMALIIGSATAGFLLWNWHPAKIFLGDIGSITLGYLLGWLLLSLAASGHPVAALILPGYYLADSGITLLKRILRREKFWQAHSQHFYQHAVRHGFTPPMVVLRILSVNACLILCALISALFPLTAWIMFIIAVSVVILLLYRLMTPQATV